MTFSTRDAARLIGLTPAQIRRYVARGLLVPNRGARGHYRFQFADMVLLRTAKKLLEASVTPRRGLATLIELHQRLGDSRSLASIRLAADGADVVVIEGGARWNARSGQGHLAFFDGLAGELAHLGGRGADDLDDGDDPDAADWFTLAVDLQALDPVRAALAYEITLELDPDCVDAHVNLGRLLQLEGRLDEADAHNREALRLVPDHQAALFASGALADQRGEHDAAVAYFIRAEAVPEAHLQLFRIFALRGDQLAAHRHQQRYRQLLRIDGDA